MLQEAFAVRAAALVGHAVRTYAYAFNNPVGFVDREGLQACPPNQL